MSPDLVVLGNLLVDDLVLPDGRTRMAEPGGATVYASLGASLWGLPVGVVSPRGDDYPVWALEALAERGIDLRGVYELGRPGVRTWLLYEEQRRQIVHRLGRPSHAEVSPTAAQIPTPWADARAFHLAPMPFEIQRDLVEALSPRAGTFLSLDPHLPLRADTLDAWRPVLARVDALFLGEDEMLLDRAPEDPRPTMQGLAKGRLRLVVFKRGPRGGLAYNAREDRLLEWEPRTDQLVDPTGAGDALAGGLLAGFLSGDRLERALPRGVVAASFAIADWGPAGLLDATREQAESRLREWYAG